MGDEVCPIRPYIIAGKLDLPSISVTGKIAELHDCLFRGHVDQLGFRWLQKYHAEGLVGIGWPQVIPDEYVVDGKQFNIYVPIGRRRRSRISGM